MSTLPAIQKVSVMKIKDLCKDERPCEKLLSKGCSSLSNGELLSILLRTGTAEENALDLGRRILREAGGSVSGLQAMSVEELLSIRGVGPFKAASLVAAFELGRRFFQEKPSCERSPVNEARKVYDLMLPVMKGLQHEECWIVFLNRALYVMGRQKVSSGGLSSTTIDNGMIVRMVMERKDVREVVLVHNHPSHNPRPGRADIENTLLLKKALEPFEIGLLDHVIVCDDCYYSFADENVSYP